MSPSPRVAILLFLGFFALSLGFQIRSGAWKSDFGGHADEAAHVVTSLMVRDYLAGGFLKTPHPMRYAEAYYERFPKVALGHYPPGFYLVAGSVLLPFRSAGTFLILMNLLAAAVGVVVWAIARRCGARHWGAIAIGLLCIVLPQSRTYTAIVMADLLLVLLGLLSAGAFGKFIENGRAADSLRFGFWAAAAILTKGSAIGLAVLPPLAILLAGKWRLFLNPRLWLAPVPVLLLALPWMLLTMGITGEGMQESPVSEWVALAVPYYGKAFVTELGWVAISALVAAGGTALVVGVRKKQGVEPTEAALWALLISGLAVPLLVPAGLDNRYLMPVVPAVLLLGAFWIDRIVRKTTIARGAAGFIPVMFVFLVIAETGRPVRKYYTGASSAVASVFEDCRKVGKEQTAGARILVVSNAGGEGAVIAAAVLQFPGDLEVARGSKLLATTDWMGRGYETAFETPAELLEILTRNQIRYVIIDPPAENSTFLHWGHSYEWLPTRFPGEVESVGNVLSERRDLKSSFDIYRVQTPD